MDYILYFKVGEYVESFDLGSKHVTTVWDKGKAFTFKDRMYANVVAERLGCKVQMI